MFERKITTADANDSASDVGLQPLEWQTLAAKIAASHDLRSIFASHAGNASGNFSCFTSGEPKKFNENGPIVNPDALADGKCSGPKVIPAANDTQSIAVSDMTLGDREQK